MQDVVTTYKFTQVLVTTAMIAQDPSVLSRPLGIDSEKRLSDDQALPPGQVPVLHNTTVTKCIITFHSGL
jgi:hypothetical protein